MDGILICGALLLAIVLMRQRGQESDAEAYAPVRMDTDDSYITGAICGSSLSLFEHSSLSSDDDWPSSSAMDDSFVTNGYEPDCSMDTSRWTDPMYAHEPDNIYHNTSMDPTYHDDDIFSNSSSIDDSFSSSSSDDSWSSGSFDDSFSSSGFND
jgi:hypothetical protein